MKRKSIRHVHKHLNGMTGWWPSEHLLAVSIPRISQPHLTSSPRFNTRLIGTAVKPPKVLVMNVCCLWNMPTDSHWRFGYTCCLQSCAKVLTGGRSRACQAPPAQTQQHLSALIHVCGSCFASQMLAWTLSVCPLHLPWSLHKIWCTFWVFLSSRAQTAMLLTRGAMKDATILHVHLHGWNLVYWLSEDTATDIYHHKHFCRIAAQRAGSALKLSCTTSYLFYHAVEWRLHFFMLCSHLIILVSNGELSDQWMTTSQLQCQARHPVHLPQKGHFPIFLHCTGFLPR